MASMRSLATVSLSQQSAVATGRRHHAASVRACRAGATGPRAWPCAQALRGAAARPGRLPFSVRAVGTETEVNEVQTADEDYTEAVDAADITFNGKKNGIYSVTGVLTSDADAELVMSILTDYDSSERIFENILDSKAVTGPEGTELFQDCRWSFLLFQGKFQAVLKVTENTEERTLRFELVRSGFMKHFCGFWTVTPTADGGCTVTHDLEVQPLLAPPPPLGFYTKRIFVKQVGEIMNDLEAEIKRRQ